MKLTCIIYLLIAIISTSCWEGHPYRDSLGYIQSGPGKIYYETSTTDSTNPPLILLHAGMLNTAMWRHQADEFSDHYKVIMIDMPGHGNTENDTFRLEPAVFMKDIMDSLHISKASIVGVSLGAACVTDFAIAHPERVNKIVLVSSGINGWATKFKMDTTVLQYFDAFFGTLEKGDTAAAAEVFTHFWFDGPFRTPAQVNDSARKYIYNTTLANMQRHHVRGWPAFTEPPAIDNISKIKVPTLIITGDKDVPFIIEAGKYLETNIAGAKRITIPNAGHMLNIEDPKAFNKAVMDFLSKNQ